MLVLGGEGHSDLSYAVFGQKMKHNESCFFLCSILSTQNNIRREALSKLVSINFFVRWAGGDDSFFVCSYPYISKSSELISNQTYVKRSKLYFLVINHVSIATSDYEK